MSDNQKQGRSFASLWTFILSHPALPTSPSMKPSTKRILCIGIVGYVAAYGVVRMKHELIHRHTWNNGWSVHWITSATDENKLRFLTYRLSSRPGSEQYNRELDERLLKEDRRTESRRFAFQCLFVPLVLAESAGHWMMHPKA